MIARDRLRDAKTHAKRRAPKHRFANQDVLNRHRRLLRNTTKLCSCSSCGNPRRYAKGADRLSIQERRAETTKGTL